MDRALDPSIEPPTPTYPEPKSRTRTSGEHRATHARPRLDLDRPFTRAALEAAGLDPAMLRRREFEQVVVGVWARQPTIDKDTMMRAAIALHPDGAWVSHLSAAELLDLPVPQHGHVHVSVSKRDNRRYRHGIKPHVTRRERRLVRVRGIPVTDPVTTFIQCAGTLSLVDQVILGDALCKKYKIKAARLVAEIRKCTEYYRGAAIRAALLVRDGVDSPMETRLRLLLVFAGLPEPQVNYILRYPNGDWRRRLDLYYALVKVVVEYEGRQHADDTKQWRGDLERREEFDDDGYRVLIVTAEGIYGDPLRTLQRVRRVLIARGMPDVPKISDEWRNHFAA